MFDWSNCDRNHELWEPNKSPHDGGSIRSQDSKLLKTDLNFFNPIINPLNLKFPATQENKKNLIECILIIQL